MVGHARRLVVMSPVRRRVLAALVLVVLVAAGVLVLPRIGDRGRAGGLATTAAAPQDQPGPVLLVPGYGGGTAGLEVLAGRLRAAGRQAVVVRPPGDGTGDLRAAADAVGAAADAALAAGAPSVDVIGYSAGGVIARLWARDNPDRVRRVVTLGSPHHGSRVAAAGAFYAPAACPTACQQLVPDSALLSELNDGDETPDGPRWTSVWTAQDEIVTPPQSARLDGALNVVVQDVCPGLAVPHGRLPTEPVVVGIILRALSTAPPAQPADCAALQSAGREPLR